MAEFTVDRRERLCRLLWYAEAKVVDAVIALRNARDMIEDTPQLVAIGDTMGDAEALVKVVDAVRDDINEFNDEIDGVIAVDDDDEAKEERS